MSRSKINHLILKWPWGESLHIYIKYLEGISVVTLFLNLGLMMVWYESFTTGTALLKISLNHMETYILGIVIGLWIVGYTHLIRQLTGTAYWQKVGVFTGLALITNCLLARVLTQTVEVTGNLSAMRFIGLHKLSGVQMMGIQINLTEVCLLSVLLPFVSGAVILGLQVIYKQTGKPLKKG